MNMRVVGGVGLALAMGALACVGDSGGTSDAGLDASKPQGGEGGPCFSNGTCDTALTCVLVNGTGVCTQLDATASDVSTDAVTEAASDVAVDAPTSGCTTYVKSTIAAMRTGATNGCFELDNVVTLGVTPTSGNPRLFVQDAAGGNYSAMLGKCSSTSTTHPCSVAAAVSALPDGHAVTLRGMFVVTTSTTLEEFFIDSVSDNGAGVVPAPSTPSLAEVTRASTAANLRYQRVSVSLPGALVMYDWSPGEFAVSNATACPYQLGFGMISQTVSFTPGAACSSGTSQPAGQTSPNAQEVLIGTDFSQTYKVSSDCRCAKAEGDLEPSGPSMLSGALAGVLVFDVAGSTGFYYVAPKTPSDAAITSTVTGQ